ncbi:hypothetical protein L873DRAFT_1027586 [Choiromyces venosus 120613-1]|uniref:Uncharacterized protein n=1 Tax=Choiromyces venosus 120613-1 TaxID=1336337 RepID=A0A3N4JJP0_9PEZI|nr:hypothetical protein L873DRAFT_1027586 [Choiromyces venosus 120613-1]
MELQPQPTKTYLIHRHRESTEYQFTTSDPGGPITHYYILAPPKYQSDQHYKKWRAIIHSGGDPKTHSPAESPITCRIARAIWWKKIYIETGGGIQREVKTDEKAFKVKSLNRSNKVRKAFCMRPKALEWSAEDESALQGFGEGLRERAREKLVMVHKGHRKYEFEVAGVKYQWTGTKLHSGGLVRGIRLNGFAYSVKLVRLEDKKLIASYQKKYNMCGSLTGFLHFYTDEKTEILPEPVIVHTAFGMIRAEKHKRDTVFEILGEIAKNAGG